MGDSVTGTLYLEQSFWLETSGEQYIIGGSGDDQLGRTGDGGFDPDQLVLHRCHPVADVHFTGQSDRLYWCRSIDDRCFSSGHASAGTESRNNTRLVAGDCRDDWSGTFLLFWIVSVWQVKRRRGMSSSLGFKSPRAYAARLTASIST